jgi:hypothetical protein
LTTSVCTRLPSRRQKITRPLIACPGADTQCPLLLTQSMQVVKHHPQPVVCDGHATGLKPAHSPGQQHMPSQGGVECRKRFRTRPGSLGLAAAVVTHTATRVLGCSLDVVKQAQEWHLLDVIQQVGPVRVFTGRGAQQLAANPTSQTEWRQGTVAVAGTHLLCQPRGR